MRPDPPGATAGRRAQARQHQGGEMNDRASNDVVSLATRAEGAATAPSSLARNTLALVLAGGGGSRLRPLTDWRSKSALPFGGRFRIIDFALSNCVNSRIRRIGICAQYRAQGLIRHVQRGW